MRQWLVGDDPKINGITPEKFRSIFQDDKTIEKIFIHKCLGLPDPASDHHEGEDHSDDEKDLGEHDTEDSDIKKPGPTCFGLIGKLEEEGNAHKH